MTVSLVVGFPVVGCHDLFEASSFLAGVTHLKEKTVCLGGGGRVKMLPLVTLSNQRGNRWNIDGSTCSSVLL